MSLFTRAEHQIVGAPRLPATIVKRPQLDSLLDASRESALTVVRAPGGVGKTIEVLQWCKASLPDEPCIWSDLSVSTPSRDGCWRNVLSLFSSMQISQLGMQAGSIQPLRGEVGVEAVIRAFLMLNRPYTLVLDSFQSIRGTAIVQDVVRLAESCEKLHIKVLSRTPSPLESAASFHVITPRVLPPQAFFLTPKESAEIAHLFAPGLSDAEQERITSLADGNALLLRSFLTSPAHTHQVSQIIESSSHGEIPSVDVVSELFAGDSLETTDLANALIDISVPRVLPRDLAVALVGEQLTTKLLKVLEENALGWWMEVEGRWVFHLHSLTRAVFQSSLAQRSTTAQHRLHQRISRWLADHGFVVAAIAHAGDAESPELIVHAIRSRIGETALEMRPDVMVEFAKLPAQLLMRDPLLCVFAGLLYNKNPDTAQLAQRYFQMAILMYRRKKPPTDQADIALELLQAAFFTGIYRVAGMLERSQKTAQQGWELAEHLAEDLRAENGHVIQTIAQQRAITELMSWNLKAASSWVRRALGAAQELPCAEGALATSYGIDALVAMEQGDVPELRRRVAASENATRFSGWSTSFRSAPEAIARARMHLAKLDTAAARAELHRMDEHWDTIEFWPFRHIVLTPICLLEGTPLEASLALDRALKLAEDRPPLSPIFHSQLQLDRVVLDYALGRTFSDHFPRATDASTAFSKALLEFRQGHNAQMVQLANRWTFQERMPLTLTQGLILLRAEALRRMGRTQAALDSLDRAFTLSAELEDLLPLTLLGGRNGTGLMQLWRRSHPGQTPPTNLEALPQILPASVSAPRLTTSELGVLLGIADGLSTAQIAESRSVSVNTVKTQTKSLYRKLQVSSRAEALAVAGDLGLLS